MYGEYEYIEVSYHFRTGNRTKSSKWKRIPKDSIREWMDAHKKAIAYYGTVQSFENPERVEGEAHWSDLFIDLDHETDPDLALDDTRFIIDYFLTGFEVEPKVWWSGNKGFHILVDGLVFGAEPNSRLTYHWRHFIEDMLTDKLSLKTVDTSVYSIPRMWRLDQTKHPKTGLYKTELSLVEVRTLSLDDIRELAKKARILDIDEPDGERDAQECIPELKQLFIRGRSEYEEKRSVNFSGEKINYEFPDENPECVTFLFENGLAALGTKNRADMALSAYLKDSGKEVESALVIMQGWAAGIPDSLTHVHSPNARIAQTALVVRTVYGNPKYIFSCGSILSCGVKVDCSQCSIKESKPKEVILADFSQSENLGIRIALEADAVGRDSQDLIVPIKIVGWCKYDPGSKLCLSCTHQNYFNSATLRNERTLVFDAKNPKTLELISISAVNLSHRIKRIFGIRDRCYDFGYDIEWGNAHNVFLASRVIDFRLEKGVSRVKAIYLGHGLKMNESYKLIGYTHTHPRTQAAIFLINEAVPLRSSLETFALLPEELKELKIFNPEVGQSPFEKVQEIHEVFINDFVYIFGREELLLAVDLCYHSARFIYFQKQKIKGWLDILVIGDTGQGKSEIVEKLMRYYDLGTLAAGETSSRTGLLYNIQMVQGEEAWVQFGLLCRANGMLVAVDEIHGMAPSDFREFTLVRSKGVVDVKKYSWGTALAETRLISIANARTGLAMDSYGYPVMAIPDVPCFRSREDIRRFDFAVGVKAGDIDESVLNTNVNKLDEIENPYTPQLCKNLILWVWTRKQDDIVISDEVQEYILQKTKEISIEYVPSIPLVEPADMRLKVTRLAVAFAGRTFSTDDGIKLLVTNEHIDSAIDMLNYLYKSSGLDYWGYSDDMAKAAITEEGLLVISFDFDREFGKEADNIARWMLHNNSFNKTLMKAALHLDVRLIDSLIAMCLNYRFIEPESFRSGFRKTSGGRNFFYRHLHEELYTDEQEDDL